jgi:putative transcriptional regulator
MRTYFRGSPGAIAPGHAYGWLLVFSLGLGCAFATPQPDSRDASLKLNVPPALQPEKGLVLLAGRQLNDPNFRRTVVLLVKHGESGTLGLVINRPTNIQLSEAIPHVDGTGESQAHLSLGGPVSRNWVMFLFRSESEMDSAQPVLDDVYFSAHQELLEQLLEQAIPDDRLRVFAGHAGWLPGQLADELERGDWHLLRLEPSILFDGNLERLWGDLIDRYDPEGILVQADL